VAASGEEELEKEVSGSQFRIMSRASQNKQPEALESFQFKFRCTVPKGSLQSSLQPLQQQFTEFIIHTVYYLWGSWKELGKMGIV